MAQLRSWRGRRPRPSSAVTDDPTMTAIDDAVAEEDRDVIAPRRNAAARWIEGRQLSPIDIAFALIVVVTAVYEYQQMHGSWFFADDWLLSLRGRTPVDFFRPYNGHLSITYIGIYRLL